MGNWLVLSVMTLSAFINTLSADWEEFKQEKLKKQHKIPGWCSEEKAQKLMDLIHEIHPIVCVEIGVYGGSSIYPTACALSYEKEGIVYAIDPWSKEECLKGYAQDDANRIWWDKLDLEKVYQDFLGMLKKYKISNSCKVMRMNSAAALASFKDGSIDILHVDGNHTEESALTDVQLFFPKVKKGGYIWFDDADWSSTNRAVAFLKENAEFYPTRSVGNSCLLFQKL